MISTGITRFFKRVSSYVVIALVLQCFALLLAKKTGPLSQQFFFWAFENTPAGSLTYCLVS